MPDGDRELVVVVGASGAFGSAIVARVVGAGRDVLAVGRNADSIAPLTERYGAAVHVCVADITDDASIGTIRAAVDGVASGGCAVRAVVHGPGLARGGDIAEVPTSVILDAVDTKVGGLLRLVRAVDERLVTGARIIAIAGHYGLEPTPYAAPAGIANAALLNVVRQLSLVYGRRGITAHAIAPGPADTDRLRRIAADRAASQGTTADSLLEELRAESSIGALTTPDQVAWAVTLLLAPEADAMTGSTLMLDAGRRRGLP